MESSAPVDGSAGPRDAPTKNVDKSPGSVMNRRRAATTLPSSFSSNLGNRNSQTVSRVSRNGSPSPCEVPRTPGGRSVKSIVRWLEASAEAPLASPKRVLAEVKQNPAASRAGPVRGLLEIGYTIPHAPGVEDHSLAYLNYKKFFTEVPLGSCLDGVAEDLSTIPLKDMFENIGKGLASEKTRVSLVSSANDAGTDVKAQGQDDGTLAATEQRATSPEDEIPRVVHRDPQEVKEFWDNVRSYLHISDDELEHNSAASESNEQPAALPEATAPSLRIPTPCTDRPAPPHTPGAQRDHSCGPGPRQLHPLQEFIAELDEFFAEEDEAESRLLQPEHSYALPSEQEHGQPAIPSRRLARRLGSAPASLAAMYLRDAKATQKE
ncbi:Uncharacterized protein TCAP_02376 [Tolypocladium capitatum]|uniref:Uncharacterized protein n=1 Tax=Tolypocladium capitatum TaxID=45235 RepID=A0A2K3QJK6_9HYPO|nr:Uncharacterized protein TCAP_02376 [Tolypocladium capitatum]